MTTMDAVVTELDRRTRWALTTVAAALLVLFAGGLGYVATRSVETITFALAFFGGMSMLLTP
jgi:TRAP-type C4-dicarboxylate transport system permease small subunit